MPGWPLAGDASTEVTLSTDMPDEAYQQLFDIDLTHYHGMTLFWDTVDPGRRATPKTVRTDDAEG
jgi:hypothetical protein